MVTDMEYFQPKRKRPKLCHRTYRLLGLKSTTPEELYTRKVSEFDITRVIPKVRSPIFLEIERNIYFQ